MTSPLNVRSILDMAFLGRKIAEGERSPKEFFEHWPDLSTEEEEDVKELWFQVQYFENDIVCAADSAEFYRAQILKFVGLLEDRYRVKWERKEEG